MELNKLLRKNIALLKPYSSAREEYTGEAMVFLDANENPFNEPYNRYPDPLQKKLKKGISKLKNIDNNKIFLGNGSDEPIDLLIRAFCELGVDNIVSLNPTYGMYQVAADISGVELRKVSLTESFELDSKLTLEKTDENTKLIFLCSPNNPTGNSLNREAIIEVIQNFKGLVILDEAYIDFAPGKSFLPELAKYPNLIVLQTFSKAWGMAGIRLGMAFASPEIIAVLNKIKYPYNINILTQQKAIELIEKKDEVEKWVKLLIAEREKMAVLLSDFPFVIQVFPSDANFLLVKMHDAKGIYNYLVEQGIIVRNRSKVHLCDNSLRITIGSSEENETLLNAFNEFI
ncbi:MAG: histidinol-phosphate transaminase [Prolixibacteraceae bacterium]|jgi:histidinol-phosphate aminotransferase|nr:histidinol-phosphate transaminase [Prolixibacteraceae bacterium]MBT6005835.1 histidinol-phosphate transaminase [Prolixibacteraceae bacterium]MBT6762970.1 histidinol-phosphate transaminase [Prolixibacteraceae bacterium]MBT6998247.1 histidinol-phosphate transaminase [Prolixibacteraceae bacterium]MBT7396293.1 histidinol-phosphate transaminase [Prolixibacteraceae bacterium]